MMNTLNNKIVWVFREPRSGSTWFTQKLCKLITREFLFFSNRNIMGNDRENFFLQRKQENNDYLSVLNTHFYCGLKGLTNYDDPVIFNITRKNRTEQFLSYYFAFSYSKNLPTAVNITKSKINLFPNYEKHKIPEVEIVQFCNLIKSNQILWDSYCSEYENETIYYEDLLTGYHSNILNTKLSMQHEIDDELPIKLPYDKYELVLNYSTIEKIILENLS